MAGRIGVAPGGPLGNNSVRPGIYPWMSPPPDSPQPSLLDLLRAQAASCTEKSAMGGVDGAEWERRAREWIEMTAAVEEHGEPAPLIPLSPRRKF